MAVQLGASNVYTSSDLSQSVIIGKPHIHGLKNAQSVIRDIKLSNSEIELNNALKVFNEMDSSLFTKLPTNDLVDVTLKLVDNVSVVNHFKQNLPFIETLDMPMLIRTIQRLTHIFDVKLENKENRFFNSADNQQKINDLKNGITTLADSIEKAHTIEHIETVLFYLKLSVGILETISGGGLTPVIKGAINLLHLTPLPVPAN